MTLKLTGIKPFLQNTEMPTDLPDCHRGQYIEQIFANNGFKINPGRGADFPDIKVDVKSRKIESRSPYTIATCSEKHIIENPYKTSLVFEKFQYWTQPLYSDTFKEIVSHKNYDFTNKKIQQRVEQGYNACRDKLINGVDPKKTYISHKGSYIRFERVKSSKNCWSVRVPHGRMKKLIAMSGSSFDSMFRTV